MSGRWTISRTKNGASLVRYFDYGTRKSWVCGETPAGVPERASLEWVVGKCRYGDVIVQAGRVWMWCAPYDEMFIGASLQGHGGAERG